MKKEKPKVYVISWIDYDEYEPYVLLCGREVGRDEFKRICDAAVAEAIERLLVAVGDDENIPPRYVISRAVKILVERHGFEEPDELHASYCDDELERAVPGGLMGKLLDHNNLARSPPMEYYQEVARRAEREGKLRRIA